MLKNKFRSEEHSNTRHLILERLCTGAFEKLTCGTDSRHFCLRLRVRTKIKFKGILPGVYCIIFILYCIYHSVWGKTCTHTMMHGLVLLLVSSQHKWSGFASMELEVTFILTRKLVFLTQSQNPTEQIAVCTNVELEPRSSAW